MLKHIKCLNAHCTLSHKNVEQSKINLSVNSLVNCLCNIVTVHWTLSELSLAWGNHMTWMLASDWSMWAMWSNPNNATISPEARQECFKLTSPGWITLEYYSNFYFFLENLPELPGLGTRRPGPSGPFSQRQPGTFISHRITQIPVLLII